MSDPALGLLMLSLIVVVIMLGFPTAFTLMGLGMFFGFIAFHDPGTPWLANWSQNRIFDLMVQRTYGAMTNDTLLSIPLFVLMGYVMERGALVDKMFYAVQLAFRRVPASLAVATLIICTFWGIASGLVAAVVLLMGVIAFNPMLKAGYDTRLAAGVITAGGTLGILIPPSVMIIVYAAIAGQSVVKLYAAAMFPGFFLAFLYLLYIIGWALINPKIAPKLPEAETRAPIPDWVPQMQQAYAGNMGIGLMKALFKPAAALQLQIDGKRFTYFLIVKNWLSMVFPFLLAAGTMAGIWWYVVIHQQVDAPEAKPVAAVAKAPAVAPVVAPAVGAAGAFLLAIQSGSLNMERTKESLFLTAKTTAMVCWLFVGSALFSAVFAILGGQQIVEHWVLSLNMTPLQFMLLSQAIIFVLGWPLEWTEIIVIFVPIFLPMLKHFDIDPILWGTLVFVNLQAAFLSPPVAMSAFYLKGVSPPHVTLNQIFAGMMPYMLIVIICMIIMYFWPGMTLWLPNYLYGN